MAAESFYHPPTAETFSPYDHHRARSSTSVVSSPASDTSFPLLQNYHDDYWTPGLPAYFDDTVAPSSHSTTYVQPINAAGWNTALSFTSQLEKPRSWQNEEKMHKRSRTLKRVALVFELVLAIWTTYTAVRYFLAYTQFQSPTGQIISLVLGAVSTLSLPLILSSMLLRFFEPTLLAEEIPMSLIMNSEVALLCLTSLCIMAPAVVSFVFVFLWRTEGDIELSISRNCHLDVDVVWLTSVCDSSSPWAVWLGLGIVRVILTAILLLAYMVFARSYRKVQRLAWRSSHPAPHGYHYKRARSHLSEQTAVAQSPPREPRPLVSAPSSPRRSFRHQSTPSSSTIATKITSRSVGTSTGTHNNPSEDSAQTLTEQQQQQQSTSQEVELVSFAERFRALVSQVDEAVQYARSASPDAVDDAADDRGEDRYTALPQRSFQSFQTGPYAYPVVGYDEYGLPYPPDEHIPMLNGFVRRMPTIESMGSREHATTSVASSLYAYDTRFGSSNSRPPTRLTIRSALSESSDRPSISRGNSLHLQLAAINANELGEVTNSLSSGTASRSNSYYTAGPDSPTTDGSSSRSLAT